MATVQEYGAPFVSRSMHALTRANEAYLDSPNTPRLVLVARCHAARKTSCRILKGPNFGNSPWDNKRPIPKMAQRA